MLCTPSLAKAEVCYAAAAAAAPHVHKRSRGQQAPLLLSRYAKSQASTTGVELQPQHTSCACKAQQNACKHLAGQLACAWYKPGSTGADTVVQHPCCCWYKRRMLWDHKLPRLTEFGSSPHARSPPFGFGAAQSTCVHSSVGLVPTCCCGP